MSNTAQDIAYYIPAKYRKILYTVLFVAGVCLAATGAGFLAVGATLPKWLLAATAVHSTLSTATHYVARTNTPSQAVEDAR